MPLIEFAAMAKIRCGANAEDAIHARNARFQRGISRSELDAASVVVGFDTSSWILADRRASQEAPFVLDQSIGHPASKEQIYSDLRNRFPTWSNDFVQKRKELVAVEEREHAVSPTVVVASSFTKQTLVSAGVSSEKIVVIPYGVSLDQFRFEERPSLKRPLRFLFVGLVNARKGIPLLLEAWAELRCRHAELWVVGPISDVARWLIPELPGLKLLGPKPHRELPEVFRQCDVFVFPSFFEGFALVLLEAMACGLPIVSTTATAAPDIITDRLQGSVIDAGSREQLSAAMQGICDRREELPEMSAAARRRAEDFSWNAYGDRWAELVKQLAPCS